MHAIPARQPLLRNRQIDGRRLGKPSTRQITAGAGVQKIVDFVHNHITFGYQYARRSRTAFEAYQERVGVCRDFAPFSRSPYAAP